MTQPPKPSVDEDQREPSKPLAKGSLALWTGNCAERFLPAIKWWEYSGTVSTLLLSLRLIRTMENWATHIHRHSYLVLLVP